MSRRNEKKSSPSTKRSIVEIRQEVEEDGIQHYYWAFKVATPDQVMLRVIFNMMASLTRDHIPKNDDDAKERLDHQQAIFELASETAYKKDQIIRASGLKQVQLNEDPFATMDKLIRSLDVPVERSLKQTISVTPAKS